MLCELLAAVVLCWIPCAAYRQPHPEDLVANAFFQDKAGNPDQQSVNAHDELHEGDILMTPGNRRLLRNGKLGFQWYYHTIPYVVDLSAVDEKYHYWVMERLKYYLGQYKINLGDCLTFCARGNTTKQIDGTVLCDSLDTPAKKIGFPNYISFQFEKKGCWSNVGMTGGKQKVNLQFPSCMGNNGTGVHELMHAIGFYHEQSRPDRDSYVYIAMMNVQSNRKNNFQLHMRSKAYDHYDYGSVMHYNIYAFRNKVYSGYAAFLTRTIYPWGFQGALMQATNWAGQLGFGTGPGVEIGQRKGFSPCDELKIRRLYSETNPPIRGGKTCKLWTERTCNCKDSNGNRPDDAKC